MNNIKHLEILNKAGKTLRGYLTIPDKYEYIVIMFHGFTGNKTEHAGHFRNISRELLINNVASLRMDFAGNGESDGDFSEFTFDTMLDDGRTIIDYCIKNNPTKKIILLGFSMGGAVASMLAKEYYQNITKIVLWSPAGNILDLIRDKYQKGEKDKDENVLIGGGFTLSKEMYESTFKYNPFLDIDKCNAPVLIIHGNKDLSVPYLFSARYAVIYPNSYLHLINNAGHGYDRFEEKEELYKKTINFIVGNVC